MYGVSSRLSSAEYNHMKQEHAAITRGPDYGGRPAYAGGATDPIAQVFQSEANRTYLSRVIPTWGLGTLNTPDLLTYMALEQRLIEPGTLFAYPVSHPAVREYVAALNVRTLERIKAQMAPDRLFQLKHLWDMTHRGPFPDRPMMTTCETKGTLSTYGSAEESRMDMMFPPNATLGVASKRSSSQ